jgi:hypothetical protein
VVNVGAFATEIRTENFQKRIICHQFCSFIEIVDDEVRRLTT